MPPAKNSNKGGVTFNEKSFAEGTMRAELAELARECCLEHGGRVVEKILANYTVAPKKSGIARHIPL